MIDDFDIWRTGNLLIKRHRDDAGVVAAQHADEIIVTLRGRRILAAVSDITRTSPARMSGSIELLLLGGTAFATILPTHEAKLALTLGVSSTGK